MIDAKELHVKADNASLYCRVIGRGEPLIVIHGGPGLSMDYLLPALDQLANDHTVIYYDQRGNGKSDGEINDVNMNLEKFIDDLHAIQNHFKLSKTGLLGHSWGGYLALAYAVKYPDRVNKLIVANSMPIVYTKPAPDQQPDYFEIMIANVLKTASLNENDAAGMANCYKDFFRHSFYDPQLVEKLNLNALTASQLKNSAVIHQIFERNFFQQTHDISSELAKLNNIPTLIIHGNGHDIPQSEAEKIHAAIKGSTLKILECGHFPYIEKPDDFFAAISRFKQ